MEAEKKQSSNPEKLVANKFQKNLSTSNKSQKIDDIQQIPKNYSKCQEMKELVKINKSYELIKMKANFELKWKLIFNTSTQCSKTKLLNTYLTLSSTLAITEKAKRFIALSNTKGKLFQK